MMIYSLSSKLFDLPRVRMLLMVPILVTPPMVTASLAAQSTASASAAHEQHLSSEASRTPDDQNQFTPAQNAEDAWATLKDNADATKHMEVRIQALAALGILGGSPQAAQIVAAAMTDPDLDVRTTAILAAGQMRDRNLANALRNALDDKEPQVAFSAANTLWKLGDNSGEDILAAVVDGERSANPTLRSSAMHQVSHDLHNPSTLARLAATQGAYYLLGPFGYGLTAYEYIKKNGGDSARVVAVEELAAEHTAPVLQELIAALKDKDLTVRAAAAKALANFQGTDVSTSLVTLFTDAKLPVQLTACAAYLRSTGAAGIPANYVPLVERKLPGTP